MNHVMVWTLQDVLTLILVGGVAALWIGEQAWIALRDWWRSRR